MLAALKNVADINNICIWLISTVFWVLMILWRFKMAAPLTECTKQQQE